MTRYAEHTEVSSERTKAEIESMLRRRGAMNFGSGWNDKAAFIAFTMDGRNVQFTLPLPDPQAREFTHTPTRDTPRSPSQAHAAWEQACRQRWRALLLAIKAKLESSAAGIETFEEAFLAQIVVPGTRGKTVAQLALPQIEGAYAGKRGGRADGPLQLTGGFES